MKTTSPKKIVLKVTAYCLMILMFSTSCTVYRHTAEVPSNESTQLSIDNLPSIKKGDRVKVKFLDERPTLRGKISDVSDDTLSINKKRKGEVNIRIADVSKIQYENHEPLSFLATLAASFGVFKIVQGIGVASYINDTNK